MKKFAIVLIVTLSLLALGIGAFFVFVGLQFGNAVKNTTEDIQRIQNEWRINDSLRIRNSRLDSLSKDSISGIDTLGIKKLK